jgi:predicted house-cleaning noncanonical NTP pyrophosphatase (MazG superfamily)
LPVFLITVIVVASLIVLAYPFFVRRNEREGMDDDAEELAQRLRRSRDRVYEEIRALQQEYFLKNLTDEEYQEQLQEARLEAASLLKQQQEVQQTLADIDEEVEAQLRKAAGDEPPGPSA